MVSAKQVWQHNRNFASEHHSGLVCVFSGATSGIGAATLEAMAGMFRDSTFYVLGRSAARFSDTERKLRTLNRSLRVVFLEADVSLLSDVDAACARVIGAESKVDLLYMSQGMMPLNRPEYTKEGLETCFALSYYSRIRLISNLLPLLRQSPAPRVLSVLNGGREQRLTHADDLGLEQASHWSTRAVINHTTTMMTLAFMHLAANRNDDTRPVVFLHAYPGLVVTDNFSRLRAPPTSGLAWRVGLALIKGLVALLRLFLGMSAEECGERQAFHLTAGGVGPGAMWRITQSSDPVTEPGVLKEYGQDSGWPERVWDFTQGVFDRVLGAKATSV